jgi:hypothetical protein
MKLLNNFAGLAVEIAAGVRRFDTNFSRSCTTAAKKTLTGFKNELRDQVAAHFAGGKLPFTWQGIAYPVGANSKDASVYVFSKAPKIMLAFDRGVTIKSKDGFYLAIPTQNCPKSYLGKPVTPVQLAKRDLRPAGIYL